MIKQQSTAEKKTREERKRWINLSSVRNLREIHSRFPKPIIEILLNREILEEEDLKEPEVLDKAIEDFLNPVYERDLFDPFLLPDIGKALTAIIRTLEESKKIAVYGDYDADGITATALLTDLFKKLGADVLSYIPSRTDEGYGLNKEAIKKLGELGAEIVEISLPHTEYGIAAYYILVPSEISSNYARFDGIRYGGTRIDFGEEVKRRIMLGTYSLSSGYYDDYYAKAAKVRTLIKQDFEKAFDPSAGSGCDVIVGPVSPTTAWNLGEKVQDPLTMYLSDAYTITANLAGIPGLSLPCGFADGLPVGLQILGKYMDEETILNIGEVYEQATEWRKEKPKLSS